VKNPENYCNTLGYKYLNLNNKEQVQNSTFILENDTTKRVSLLTYTIERDMVGELGVDIAPTLAGNKLLNLWFGSWANVQVTNVKEVKDQSNVSLHLSNETLQDLEFWN